MEWDVIVRFYTEYKSDIKFIMWGFLGKWLSKIDIIFFTWRKGPILSIIVLHPSLIGILSYIMFGRINLRDRPDGRANEQMGLARSTPKFQKHMSSKGHREFNVAYFDTLIYNL